MFESGRISPELRRAETLRKWLLEKWLDPMISVRAIVRCGPNSIRESKTVKAAIAILVEHGWLISVGKNIVEGQNVNEAWFIIRGST